MTRGQRLAAVLGAVATLLLAGRGIAILYADRAWYTALGARTVWDAKAHDTAMLYAIALVVGMLFALVNVLAVRNSIVALIVPKRVGTLEIGEEIPATRLWIVALGISVFVAIVGTFAIPSWSMLALWRAGVHFGETDPYFGLDLSHYVTGLPLESAIYTWAFVVFAIVALLVLALYSLTPSLSWGRRGVRTTTHVRRHVTVLATILLLLLAWGFHIDAYQTLISRDGLSDVFTQVDHRWLVPTYITLSLITTGAAVVLLAAGWWGHALTSLLTISAVILCTLASKVAMPWVATVVSRLPTHVRAEAPYTATRRIYTDRAFPVEAVPLSARHTANAEVLSAASRLQIDPNTPSLVYPGANGVLLTTDSVTPIAAPRMGGGVGRLMHAWAEQNLQLIGEKVPANTAIIQYRDVQQRVRLLAPIFAQASTIGWRPTSAGILWLVDLYTTSEAYPLSTAQYVGRTRVNYRRHAATAYVNGVTGVVTIVPDRWADAVATAWFRRYGGSYVASTPPAAWSQPPLAAPSASRIPNDSAFRTRVAELYARMRTALGVSDLQSFGVAFDSLGILLKGQPPDTSRGTRSNAPPSELLSRPQGETPGIR